VDDFTFRNNTFYDISFPLLPNKPFFDIQSNPSCDMLNRTQNLIFDSNTFVNLSNSGIQVSINYLSVYLTSRVLSITNNIIKNATCITLFTSP
jgi:hypothetical protein